ncbi:MAG: flippase-like domain-containing protein [Planctomycetes bacterium]|nr:flippase-like domain-containing protein [Planctomycetota bacterium]
MFHSRKRIAVLLIGFVISGLALFYFFSRLQGHWGEVLLAFMGADYRWLIPGVGFLGLLYAFRVLRWRVFLNRVGLIRYSSIASATCIGFMANCILPARVGELIRPYVLYRKENLSFGYALASSAGLERVFDLMTLGILTLITWGMLSARIANPEAAQTGTERTAETTAEMRGSGAADEAESEGPDGDDLLYRIWQGGMIFAVLAGIGVAILSGVALFPDRFYRLGAFFLRFFPASWQEHLEDFLRSLTEAMGFLRNLRGVSLAFIYSMGVWFSLAASTYAIGRALDLDLGLAGSCLAVIAVAAAVAVPQGPAFVGPFQAAAWAVARAMTGTGGSTTKPFTITSVLLVLFGGIALVGGAGGVGTAGAFALLMWIVNVVPITIVGLGFLWYEGLSLKRLTAESQKLEEEEAL